MRILLSFLLLATLVPVPAHAYLTPEEVLEEGDFVEPPPNARGAKAARQAQEATYDERAAAEAANGITDTEAAEEDGPGAPGSDTIDDLHGSAEEDEVIDWTTSDASAQERRDDRVLDRVERNRLDDMARGGEVILHGSAPDEQLHGGAPLAPTGPGTIAAVLAIAAAVGLTLRKALKA